MTTPNENSVEQMFIEQLEAQGYTYYPGAEIAPGGENPQRENLNSVILEEQFKASLRKLNPDVPESARAEAYQKVVNVGSPDCTGSNENFHDMLINGVKVEYQNNGNIKGVQVHLIDAEHLEKNTFWVVNQFIVKEENEQKRLDVVLFVNGLPLVIVELKNPFDEKATLKKAYTQLQNYKTAVPHLFHYNALCIISDGMEARTSSFTAPYSRYLAWKAPKAERNKTMHPMTELQTLTQYMLHQETLLHLIRYCTVFETEKATDKKTGLVSQFKVKKIAAYHQYYAVQAAIKQTLRASDSTGDGKIGVVWHTQGSGKSLSMVFFCARLVTHPQMKNPTVVVITDRNDLDDQLFGTFSNCASLLRTAPIQAPSKQELHDWLEDRESGGIIFTTIQKFSPVEGGAYERLSNRKNIVVIADEAHRSQYGFQGHVVQQGSTSEIKYGNAKHLRDALPNAAYIGFTGTPIEKEDRSTPAVFGKYIDVYDIKQAVDDGATVPINYEQRLIQIKIDKAAEAKLDREIEALANASEEELEGAKKRTANIDAVVGHPDRLRDVAKDIVTHFEARQELFEGKAMVVCMTRNICVELYKQIIALKPEWHDKEIDKGAIKVVMTSSSDDPAPFQAHHTTKSQRKDLALRMKDPEDALKIAIVRDMWLTGFDAPCVHTMYVDKRMQGANLMQAIARVNRVYKDKPGGLIVDYIGIGQDLRNAMHTYIQSGGEGNPIVNIKEVIAKMKEKFEIVQNQFYGYDYKAYFKADTHAKLQVLLGAVNFVLMDQEELKNRFLKEVTALSKLFVMAIPNAEAEAIKDEVAFFQAVKTRINKMSRHGSKATDYDTETAIRQMVEGALSSEGVMDIYEAAGIAAPSVDILSDEFLLEVKNMQHKNIAFELLRKLLNDEISKRKHKNLELNKKFSEMLASAVKRYHNNQIDSAQVLEELSVIAHSMRLEDKKAEELGLTQEEYAFYSVLKKNKSTDFLNDEKTKELIHAIVQAIRKNATVDWTIRDDVRAKLRLAVKKLLMRYGYPPDLARMEADKVIKQGESLASFFSKDQS